MSNLSVFQYSDAPISFRKETGSLFVNATEMAKGFGKTTKDWLRTKQSEEFISSLSTVRQISPTGLVQIIQGGNP
ncbi:KilA-N domain-containing protein, partial [Veillonella nakazawae]|nr:KilA-N domain-containing protein [Veillonella nakazawae]